MVLPEPGGPIISTRAAGRDSGALSAGKRCFLRRSIARAKRSASSPISASAGPAAGAAVSRRRAPRCLRRGAAASEIARAPQHGDHQDGDHAGQLARERPQSPNASRGPKNQTSSGKQEAPSRVRNQREVRIAPMVLRTAHRAAPSGLLSRTISIAPVGRPPLRRVVGAMGSVSALPRWPAARRPPRARATAGTDLARACDSSQLEGKRGRCGSARCRCGPTTRTVPGRRRERCADPSDRCAGKLRADRSAVPEPNSPRRAISTASRPRSSDVDQPPSRCSSGKEASRLSAMRVRPAARRWRRPRAPPPAHARCELTASGGRPQQRCHAARYSRRGG